MAVLISKDLTAADIYNGSSVFTDYLAGYNSTIVRWGTTLAKTIKTGEIWFNISMKFVDLVPLNNVVEFDCYEVIKTLFGSFDDFLSYQTSEVIKYDGNLFNLHAVKLVVNYTDNTSENVDITGKFTRAVRQHTDMSNGMFYFTGDGPYPHFTNLLMKAPRKKDWFTQQIRIFKGYPLDVSLIFLLSQHFPNFQKTDPNQTDLKALKEQYLINSNLPKGVYASHTLKAHNFSVKSLALDGQRLFSSSHDKTIKIWDLNTNTCTATLQGHSGAVYSLKLDGERLVSGSGDNTIKIWDLTTNTCT